jgi:hypothetical protein
MIYGNLPQTLKRLTIIRITLVLFSYILFSCNLSSTERENEEAPAVTAVNYQFLILPNRDPLLGWGYEIYSGEKAIIRQETIPAVNGIVSFKTEEDAAQTAALVIEKLKRGKPPLVSKKELDSLGVDTRLNNH